LRILGRQSEVINVGGEKVSPSEIEDVILQVDNIEEVVVRHKANPLTGHVVVATVRTCYDEDDRAVAARVRAHCQQHLSPYKVPALIQVTRAELMGRRFKKIRQPDLSDTIDMELAGVG
jgi:acyl-coenzyme A synthetase/AMP-(fatty) acid ligase